MGRIRDERTFQWDGYICTHVRSARKTCAIEVRSGCIIVRTPWAFSSAYAVTVLNRHREWVRLRLRDTIRDQAPRLVIRDGTYIPYRGKSVRITLCSDISEPVRLKDGQLHCAKMRSARQRAIALERWYRAQARECAQNLIAHIAPKLSVQPARLRIADTSTRWGSCSSRGTISICWRLIMAPDHVFEYVVCHELSHLVHMNHGAAFWETVARICPQYLKAKQWLRINASILVWRV